MLIFLCSKQIKSRMICPSVKLNIVTEERKSKDLVQKSKLVSVYGFIFVH